MELSEQFDRLAALDTYVGGFERSNRDSRDFWREFDRLAGNLCDAALADEADADVRERYCGLLARIDDMGYAVPDVELGRW